MAPAACEKAKFGQLKPADRKQTLMRPIKHLRASFAIAVNNLTTKKINQAVGIEIKAGLMV